MIGSWAETSWCLILRTLSEQVGYLKHRIVVGNGKLIFVKNLKDIVKDGNDDTGLEASVCHVVAIVRSHDGRSVQG